MIASLRGLVALAAAAVVLAVVLVIDLVHTPAPANRALVPGFDADHVEWLSWSNPSVAIARSGLDQPWQYCVGAAPVAAGSGITTAAARERMQPDTGEVWCAKSDGGEHRRASQGWRANLDALDSALSALRGARWHRRGDARAAGRSSRELEIQASGHKTIVRLGGTVAGTDQQWVAIDGASYLVDGWVARALFPAADTLLDREVFPDPRGAPELELASAHGRVVLHHGQRTSALWIDHAIAERVFAALEAVKVEATRASGDGTQAFPWVTYTIGKRPIDVWADSLDSCPHGTAIDGTAGPACVDTTAWSSLDQAITSLFGPPAEIVDRRPLPIVPVKFVVPGGTLDLAAMHLDDKDADRDQVRALVAALSAPAEVVPAPSGKPTATIVATDKAGTTVTLDLLGGVLERRGEPVGLKPSREALATILRPASALLDPTRWVEDPLVVAELAVDGVTYRRGAVVGEWTREPAGTVDPVAIEALATALSQVRAPEAAAVGPAAHHVVVKLAPPVGTPATHTLDIDAHCAARLDGAPVQLDPGICAALENIRNRSPGGPH